MAKVILTIEDKEDDTTASFTFTVSGVEEDVAAGKLTPSIYFATAIKKIIDDGTINDLVSPAIDNLIEEFNLNQENANDSND